jgi:O-antigen/teichoic acid export membrane protein
MLKKLASETAIYGVSSILSRLLNYVILTPYLTRAFLTGEYGVVSDMYVYAGLLMVLFTYRMETTFFRFAKDKENRDKVFSTTAWSIIISTVVLVGLLLSFSQGLANLLHYPNNQDYVIWFIFIIAFDALAAIPFARLRLENRPIRFAVLKTLGILVNIFFIFSFLEICPWLIEQGFSGIANFYNEGNRISYVFVANLLASLAVLLLLLPEFRHLKPIFDKGLWKKMMIYAMPLVIVGFASVINQLISMPLMKELLPYDFNKNMEQVGIYAACAKIAILMSLFTQAFNYAAEPFFFRNADRSDAKKTYAQVAQAFTLVGSLAFLGIMMYIDIIRHFIGSDFQEGLSVVPILLIAFLLLGIYYNFSIWYKLTDRTKFGAYISLTGVAVTLALNFILIPKIGYLGGAWAALACYATMTILSYQLGQKYFPVNYPIGKISLYIGSAILVYLGSTQVAFMTSENLGLRLLVNTLFLLSWVGAIYSLEKKNLSLLLKS